MTLRHSDSTRATGAPRNVLRAQEHPPRVTCSWPQSRGTCDGVWPRSAAVWAGVTLRWSRQAQVLPRHLRRHLADGPQPPRFPRGGGDPVLGRGSPRARERALWGVRW